MFNVRLNVPVVSMKCPVSAVPRDFSWVKYQEVFQGDVWHVTKNARLVICLRIYALHAQKTALLTDQDVFQVTMSPSKSWWVQQWMQWPQWRISSNSNWSIQLMPGLKWSSQKLKKRLRKEDCWVRISKWGWWWR